MLALTQVTCENLENPLGLENPSPRLGWQILSDVPYTLQIAYHIQVCNAIPNFEENLFWDSGRINSDESTHAIIDGIELESHSRYYYRVKIWDNHQRESEWSSIHFWEMGFLDPNDWVAQWICPPWEEDPQQSVPATYFRKEIRPSAQIKHARIYASALGLYEIHLNGVRVGDEYFTPGQTGYNYYIQYQTYDVTALLADGKNVVVATLGQGWYRGRFQMRLRNSWGEIGAILIQIHLVYQDGTEEILTTDESWKASTGAIRMSDIYDGEEYDAQLEDTRFTLDYDDSTWQSAKIYSDYSHDHLAASLGVPVRKIEEIRALKVITTPKGEAVVDLGQNMVGWIRLKVKGSAGHTIRVDHAEVLIKGNFYRKNLRSAQAKLIYTCKGTGEYEIFEPHFTFFGFRYVKISNYDAVTLDTVTGVVIHSDMPQLGTFECSEPMLNQLQHNILWGQKGNFLDVPTDCPQRNERVGWTGDAQVFARTACFNMDTERFFKKWMKDLRYHQRDDGAIPPFFPGTREHSFGSAGWGDVASILPWHVYLVYGDKRVLEMQYDSIKKWVEFQRAAAQGRNWKFKLKSPADRKYWDYIWELGHHYGDWLAPGQNTFKRKRQIKWIATAYYAYSTQILAKIAGILQKSADEVEDTELYHQIQKAYLALFIDDQGHIKHGFQTAYVLALDFGLLTEPLQKIAAQDLANDVKAHDNHLTTGFLGTPQLCFALSNHGQLETAYDLLFQTTCPSWLYPIKYGDATTIWERWNAIRPNGRANNPVMTSFNHYAYGAIGDWMYRVVAGINTDDSHPGYKKIRLTPHPDSRLQFAKATFQSRYGLILSKWEEKNSGITYTFSIPPNTTATITLPTKSKLEVKDLQGSGDTSLAFTLIKQNASSITIEVGSGEYTFHI